MRARLLFASVPLLALGCFSDAPSAGAETEMTEDCPVGSLECPCSTALTCLAGLECGPGGVCIAVGEGSSTTSTTSTTDGSTQSSEGTASSGSSTDTTTGNPTTGTTGSSGGSESSSSGTGECNETTAGTSGAKPVERVNLYFTRSGTSGEWTPGADPRASANALCEDSAALFATFRTCDHHVAIISVDECDTVANLDIPDGPVHGARSDMMLATSFSVMLDDGLTSPATLGAGEVTFADLDPAANNSGPDFFPTGSTEQGDLGNACASWTLFDGTTVSTGERVGPDSEWLSSNAENLCGAAVGGQLLCACWQGV